MGNQTLSIEQLQPFSLWKAGIWHNEYVENDKK